MASLNKLAIRGIRSFDDKQISVIEFFSPVTVIVGHNGSGKTTIIECLKYATTGDQPPNTRGGAFIHDPKMANEKEVKAQVKLRFNAANGTRMLAVRNLSVTVKKTAGLTMKTLESILALAGAATDKAGKRSVISTKCAEMDAEIPQLLGVSKSVLENVIFCHQEDSYWPLAEPAALKKKFDDIFEATRYTKALDAIKALRKDRVAELKAEKERLVGLAREKSHADKLKGRIADLNNTISAKEIEYEETKKQHDLLVISNQKFYDSATKFRELYLKIENLQEKKTRLMSDLDEARLSLQEVVGTDAELATRLKNFDENINAQKQAKQVEDKKMDDLEDQLAQVRKQHTELIQQRGTLVAEADAQKQRIGDREQLIHEISQKYGIKGYHHSPLEREKVIEFLSRLADVQKKQRADLEKLQTDLRAKTEEYNRKARQLDNSLQAHKLEKRSLRDQISERQSSIMKAERSLESQQGLPAELKTLSDDIEEKKARLEKTKLEMAKAKYDSGLAEKTEESKTLESRREELNAEIRTLSLQADTRARLELKRGEVKSKTSEIQTTLEMANAKFRKLVGRTMSVETIESDVERISFEKEQEQTELDSLATAANNLLQKAETTLSNSKAQLKAKKEELKALDKKMKDEIDGDSLDALIVTANEEVDHRKKLAGDAVGGSAAYESLLSTGKEKKICGACNRHLDNREIVVFEKSLKDLMKKASKQSIPDIKAEMLEWGAEAERLQGLRPLQASRDRLKLKEVPEFEEQVKAQEAAIPGISKRAEEALEKLHDVKRESKDIVTLKQHSATVLRLQKELERSSQDISNLESDLLNTGSTKTADDVQAELDTLSVALRFIDKEKQKLTSDREHHNNKMRALEGSLHKMELRERDLTNELREKTALEERMEAMKKDITTFTVQLKDLESKITEAQVPIAALDMEYQEMQSDLNSKITQAQHLSQELNISVDKLNHTNKGVERYVKDKRARQLDECEERVKQHDTDLLELGNDIETLRGSIAKIERSINESGSSVANLRENIRARKLGREIADTQKEIDSHDMEEAARAKRNFEEKFNIAKDKENDLHTQFSHISGEVSSHKVQLKSWELDLREFKDIYNKYNKQLITVKMSDMANSDLEKYAKALDNAIMKYHGLKMEEVNDTMRHLWNKTYQGTDIDGIKIRSDVEGGASKRSYNYRVVMTKDQVEMDMRGRCSAGQKMLASIIIRLALSDSFGQNCGILALDEPTNALDTENIEALAASLVDIINERKNHSNFQLIIITHDENFLRRLGQSNVMEYYWRVSRDERQKSVIERQRFR